jgi:uncharacterized protein with HEPN domain
VRDPKERIKDILEAIDHIERYSAQGRSRFENEELIQSWFTRHLQIIGEAARLIPEDIRQLAPEVPWTKMIGMRHILVHDYFRIDTEIVWQVVATELPRLKLSLQLILKNLEQKS